jgi:hypothetical protein
MRRALAHRGVQRVVTALFCYLAAGIVSLALLGSRGQLTPLHHHGRRWPRRGRPRQPAQPARADRPVAEVAFVLGPLIIGFAAGVIAGRRDGGRG